MISKFVLSIFGRDNSELTRSLLPCQSILSKVCVFFCSFSCQVYDAAPPPRKVGVANLPPLTSTGDTLWHGAKHYKVLRVSSHYK